MWLPAAPLLAALGRVGTPILTTLAPQLVGPTIGYFIDAGRRTAWNLKKGRLVDGDGAPLELLLAS